MIKEDSIKEILHKELDQAYIYFNNLDKECQPNDEACIEIMNDYILDENQRKPIVVVCNRCLKIISLKFLIKHLKSSKCLKVFIDRRKFIYTQHYPWLFSRGYTLICHDYLNSLSNNRLRNIYFNKLLHDI